MLPYMQSDDLINIPMAKCKTEQRRRIKTAITK